VSTINSILVFGAGELQGSLIEVAKSKGFFTVAIDPDPQALNRHKPDHFAVVGGQDFEGTLAIAKRFNVNGIATAATDKPLLMMARIAETLRLPFPSLESVTVSTYKHLLKEKLLKAGIPVAKGIVLEKDSGAAGSLAALRPPLIIKPVDSSGSRGVLYCETLEEVVRNLAVPFRYSKSNRVLVEEFIPGNEISVESITFDHETRVLQYTDKLTTDFPYNVELGHIQPASLTRAEKSSVDEVVKGLVRAVGLNNCPCHTELKLTPGGPVIIENGARLGGDYITSDLVPLSTGINMEALVVDLATNTPFVVPAARDGGAVIKYLTLDQGTVTKVVPTNNAEVAPELVRCMVGVEQNTVIREITNSLDRYGFVITRAKDRREAIRAADAVLAQIRSNISIAKP
jgi:biotin carboxylase